MRDVVLQQIVSLDGFSCADGSEFQQFVFSADDPELDVQSVDDVGRAGTHVMGRVSYEVMAQYFPSASGPNADVMNRIPKVVFSRTLERADWPESRIARGDLREEIAQLKAEPGGEILVHGGIRFAQSLVQLDLVDRIRLYVFPVVIGRGDSVFSSVDRLGRYAFTSSRQYASQAVRLELRRATTDAATA